MQEFIDKLIPEYDVLITSRNTSDFLRIWVKSKEVGSAVQSFFQEVDKLSKGALIEKLEGDADYSYAPSPLLSKEKVLTQLVASLEAQGFSVKLEKPEKSFYKIAEEYSDTFDYSKKEGIFHFIRAIDNADYEGVDIKDKEAVLENLQRHPVADFIKKMEEEAYKEMLELFDECKGDWKRLES